MCKTVFILLANCTCKGWERTVFRETYIKKNLGSLVDHKFKWCQRLT